MLAGDRPRFARLFVIDYLEKGARYNVLDVFGDDGKRGLQVWSTEYRVALFQADYDMLLQTAGFTRVDFYGSFRFEPYSANESTRLIAVAHK